MKTPSTESFHSTRSRPSSTSESPPPPESTFHRNAKMGMPLNTTLTTHYVGQLNNQCQTLGLSARYEIEGDQQIGFGGYLQLGPHTITMDERWPSKKAAREGLAPKGLDIVKALQSKRAEEAISAENWVGLLHSKLGYPRNQCRSIFFCSTYAHKINAHTGGLFFPSWPCLAFHQICGQTADSVGPIFTEYAVGSLFACTCRISLHSTPFGSESVVYTSKKAARASAAREAMKFLISFGYATPEGKPGPKIKPEKSPAPAAGKWKKSGLKNGTSVDAITTVLTNTDAPFAQKVNGEFLCHFSQERALS